MTLGSDDLTPNPDAPTLAELNALVRRLLERVKALEDHRIVDTINEHEDRLDTHEERLNAAEETLVEIKREYAAASTWRAAIEKKVGDISDTVHRIEAVLLRKAAP